MSKHTIIQGLLYDYLYGELGIEERARVDEHLSSCTQCTAALHSLKAITASFVEPSVPPSEERPPEFWENFALNVEHEIRRSSQRRTLARLPLEELIRSFFVFHRALAGTVGGAVAVVILIFLTWQWFPPSTPAGSEQHATVQATADTATQRVSQYFRKSKALLVGVTNMKSTEGQAVDLTYERRISRELIHEARYLKQQTLDKRSTRLINDLEKIMIGLANAKESPEKPGVDLIRDGIHQENLLFKVRMAEAMYDSPRYREARNTYLIRN